MTIRFESFSKPRKPKQVAETSVANEPRSEGCSSDAPEPVEEVTVTLLAEQDESQSAAAEETTGCDAAANEPTEEVTIAENEDVDTARSTTGLSDHDASDNGEPQIVPFQGLPFVILSNDLLYTCKYGADIDKNYRLKRQQRNAEVHCFDTTQLWFEAQCCAGDLQITTDSQKLKILKT